MRHLQQPQPLDRQARATTTTPQGDDDKADAGDELAEAAPAAPVLCPLRVEQRSGWSRVQLAQARVRR